MTPAARTELLDLGKLFLKLGTTAFGGPAAHIAMMQDEVCTRRRWLTDAEFLDLVSACNLIPGPNSTELAIHIGHRRAGWPGLLVAGAAFILPATLIVTACAWAYVRYGSLPVTGDILYGIKPVIIAVVVQALYTLGRAALKTRTLQVLAVAALASALAGVDELLLLGIAAAAGIALRRRPPEERAGRAAEAGSLALAAGIFWPFVKIGSVLYGSGYVLLAFLRAEFVTTRGWLTETQLLDAVAVGQFTPGPVFTTATFIGYVLDGAAGAAAATAGIFLPAFVFVALSGPLVPRLRRSPRAGAALDAVNAASWALMAAVSLHLAHAAVVDVPTAVLAIAAAGLLIKYKLNSAWLVAAGGLVGLLRSAFL